MSAENETCLFVSPKGNDEWSGTLPEPNADHADGPFATLKRARDAVRGLRGTSGAVCPVRVVVRGGTYRLREPLVFGPEDGGTADTPVVWTAADGEAPTITGLQPLAGEWRAGADCVWCLRLPDVAAGTLYFRQLFVNSRRLDRTRLPQDGYFTVYDLVGTTDEEHRTAFRYRHGDVRRWRNLEDVEFVMVHSWSESRLFVKAIDEAEQAVRFTGPAAYPLNFGGRNTYWTENVAEALDSPGQWYLERRAGVLHVIPPEGVDLREVDVSVAVTRELVRVEGTQEQPVAWLRFRGLTFSGTKWEVPPEGYANGGGANGPHVRPAAITFRHAADSSIEDCTVENTATYAVELDSCVRCRVERSTIREAGGGGVYVSEGEDNAVRHCTIHHCGRHYLGGTGVVNPTGVRTHIAHNHVHHMPYCGIRGGNWGRELNEIIEFNHVHDVMLVLDDGAGIFNAGIGSVIRNNLVHDCVGGRHGFAIGLYLDEFRTGVCMENNIAYNAGREVLHLHSNYGNTIVNNIFAFGGPAQISWTRFHGIHFGVRRQKYRHPLQRFQRNIVYWHEGCLSHNLDCNRWDLASAPEQIDHNLYWKAGREDLEVPRVGTVAACEVRMGRGHISRPGVGHDTFADWQELGLDRHSLNEDPLFVDPDNGDFALRPDSPAFKLGFKPIDVSEVGPGG